MYHMKLHTTVQVLGNTIPALANVKLQTGETVSRVDGPVDPAWMGFSSITKSFLLWFDI